MAYSKQNIEERIKEYIRQFSHDKGASITFDAYSRIHDFHFDINEFCRAINREFKVNCSVQMIEYYTVAGLADLIIARLKDKGERVEHSKNNNLNNNTRINNSLSNYNFSKEDIEEWVKNLIIKHGNKRPNSVTASTNVVSSSRLSETDILWKIFDTFRVQIPEWRLKNMTVFSLTREIHEEINKKNSGSFQRSFISLRTLTNPPLSGAYFCGDRDAGMSIYLVDKAKKDIIQDFIIFVIFALIPFYFFAPSIVREGRFHASLIGWIISVPCLLIAIIAICMSISTFRQFKGCTIAYDEKKKRIFTTFTQFKGCTIAYDEKKKRIFTGRIIKVLAIIITSCSLFNVPVYSKTHSFFGLESTEYIKLSCSGDNEKDKNIFESVNGTLDDGINMIASDTPHKGKSFIIWTLVVTLILNCIACTFVRTVINKFAKMQTDGVLLRRGQHAQDFVRIFKTQAKLTSEEQKEVLRIKSRSLVQMTLLSVWISVMIFLTAYFAVIRPGL